MQATIDLHQQLEITGADRRDEGGDVTTIADLDSTYRMLEAWVAGAPEHRGYRFGTEAGDDEPSAIIVAWVAPTGKLILETVDPHWDGVSVLNAYSLNALAQALPVGALSWSAP